MPRAYREPPAARRRQVLADRPLVKIHAEARDDPRLRPCRRQRTTPSTAGSGLASSQEIRSVKLGIELDASTNTAEIDESLITKPKGVIESNRRLRQSFVQRGYWVHGVKDLRGYLESAAQFTLDGRAEEIRCPTFLTAAG